MKPGQAAPDQRVRERALDAWESFIVQAPAGSGKTELLIQRFLALLGRVNEPEAVLAITFTRKAAGEMRARVLKALEAAERGQDAETAHEAITLRLALAASARDAERGWGLLDNPGRLRIQTIDSLCAQITARMPWISRFGGQPAVVEDASELYAEAARRTVGMIEETGDLGEAAAHVALHLDNDLRRLRLLLENLLPRRDQWLRHIGVGDLSELKQELERRIMLLAEHRLRATRALLPREVERRLLDCFNFAAPNRGWLKREQLPGADWQELECWQNLASLLLTGDGEWRKTVNERDGFPASQKAIKSEMMTVLGRLSREDRLCEALSTLVELPKLPIPERQWEALEALVRLLPAAAAQLKLVFRERRQVDFVEVVEAARRALGDVATPSDLALYLGERFEHILVDEAQDTSVSQLELLRSLAAGWAGEDGHTLFVVGDPMQSIYRFREADVSIFLKLRREGLGEETLEALRLSANFRSTPEITGWVNRQFEQVFPPEEDPVLGAVAYNASEPVRGSVRGSGVTVHPLFEADMDAEAELVADLVEENRGKRTAILVRARTHAVAIVDVLKKRGVRFRAVDLDPLSARPVVNDLMALTRALVHLGDRTAWLSILRAPWCGLSLAELLKLAENAGPRTIWEALGESGNARALHVRTVMEGALKRVRREPLREVVEQTWMALGGPLCLENEAAAEDAKAYLRLVERYEDAGELDVTMIEQHAERLFAQPDPDADGSLEIMTIHKAKGLEWETVIVPGMGRGPGQERRPLLRWSEVETGEGPTLLLAPIEATDDDKDPLYEFVKRSELDKAGQEGRRLLYVAATRARERLHLLGHVLPQEKGPGIRNPHGRSLLNYLWPQVRAQYEEAWAARQQAPPPQMMFLFQDSKLPQTIQRLAALPQAEKTMAAAATAGGALKEFAADSRERVVGVIIHGFLERMARTGELAWDAAAVKAAAEFHGVEPEQVGLAVARALERTVADPRAQWILRRREAAQVEWAISDAGERRVIDRTFIEDGVRWVVDYKTGAGTGYREQLERYGRLVQSMEGLPVRLGVYFPLTGEWEDWAL